MNLMGIYARGVEIEFLFGCVDCVFHTISLPCGDVMNISSRAPFVSLRIALYAALCSGVRRGDFYVNKKTKSIEKKPTGPRSQPLFVELVLTTIWQVYRHLVLRPNKVGVIGVVPPKKQSETVLFLFLPTFYRGARVRTFNYLLTLQRLNSLLSLSLLSLLLYRRKPTRSLTHSAYS
jgi:hypothetical protein